MWMFLHTRPLNVTVLLVVTCWWCALFHPSHLQPLTARWFSLTSRIQLQHPTPTSISNILRQSYSSITEFSSEQQPQCLHVAICDTGLHLLLPVFSHLKSQTAGQSQLLPTVLSNQFPLPSQPLPEHLGRPSGLSTVLLNQNEISLPNQHPECFVFLLFFSF